MQINNNGWQEDIPGEIEEEDDDDDTNRDLELENIAGNFMIAEYDGKCYNQVKLEEQALENDNDHALTSYR